MESDAKFVGNLPRLDEKALGLLVRNAELMLERDAAVFAGTEMRTKSSRSLAPSVSSTIFCSSSSVSKAKHFIS